MGPGVDPLAVALTVLRAAEAARTAADLRQALERAGIDPTRAWPSLQRRLRRQPGVVVEGRRSALTYRLAGEGRVGEGRVGAAASQAAPVGAAASQAAPAAHRRGAWVGAAGVRAAGVGAAGVGAAGVAAVASQAAPAVSAGVVSAGVVSAGAASAEEASAEAARRRQATIDGLRGMAELAAEVEELVADGASGEAIVARVRSRARRSGLEPLDRAGARASFDRARHVPIGGSIADAAPVTVVRPGYLWKSPDGDVLMSRAVVEQE